MCRCLCATILVLLVSLTSWSQWERQNSTVGATLWDICFIDSLYGWAVGDSGTIVSTSDGGATWTRIMGPIDGVAFGQVEFLDRLTGFVAGNTVRLLQTTNGGLTWERRDSLFDPNLGVRGFQFLNCSYGLIGLINPGQNSWADRKGVLLKTCDAGRTWSVLQEKDSLLIGTVCFLDTSLGYTFWSPGMDNFDNTDVYQTQNGGSGWTHTGTIAMEMGVRRGKCLPRGTIWAIGLSTSRSVDSGRTWKSWNWFSPVLAGQKRFVARDLEVLDADNVWLVGNAFTSASDNEGMLLRTSNSGQDWWPDLEVASSGFQALSVVSGKAWIAGMGGLIMHSRNIVSGIALKTKSPSTHFELHQNYPNPSNPSTTIRYTLPQRSHVTLTMFNALGQLVSTLVNGEEDPGYHEVKFDGSGLASGVYFYRLSAGSFVKTMKMLSLR
jgi:photosystem II stability/assembly factor-like uncharacterized protein